MEECSNKDLARHSERQSNPEESSAGDGVSGTCVLQLFAKLGTLWAPTVSCLLKAQQLHHLWLPWTAHKGAAKEHPMGRGEASGLLLLYQCLFLRISSFYLPLGAAL